MNAEAQLAPGGTVRDELKPAIGARDWWMVFVLFIFYVMSYVDRTIIAHLVDPIKRSFQLGDFQMSLVLGPAFALSFSLAAFPAGWLVDRFDRRLLSSIAILFWSLMTMACGFAQGLVGLIVARMLLAVGEAMLQPVAYALIADRFPKDRLGSALAVYNTGGKAGTSVAYFSAAIAITAAGAIAVSQPQVGLQTWQIVFVLVGLPGLVLAFLPLTFPKPPVQAPLPKAGEPGAAIGLVEFLKHYSSYLLPMMAGIALVAIINGALVSWLPTFMQRTYGWSAAQYGPPLGVITGLAALLTVGHGFVVDWLYRKGVKDAANRYYSWMLVVALPLACVAFLLPSPWYFLFALAGLYFIVFPYVLYFAVSLQMITPSHIRGRVTGLTVATIPIFSQGFGPMLIGALTDFVLGGPQTIGLALAYVSGVGVVGAFIFLRIAIAKGRHVLP